ncbi:MAG TPA: cytochrome c biogenesis protein DipZ [Candidatus Limnocylindrales bacterium]
MLLLIVVAFVAGLVTAVSPCVLPILPIVLATGADGDRRRPYLVIAGLIASFSFFTLASVQIIQALHLPSSTLRDIAIAVIAVFGLTLLVPALTTGYERLTARLPGVGVRLARPGVAGGLITGVGLGLVWTPCAGPILGAITSLAVTAPGSGATLTLVVVYSIGAGLPLLAIALGGRAALARLGMRSASAWASKVFGVLVLATAGLMAVGADTVLSADLTSALPNWTGTLQTLERVGQVQSALGGLGVGQQSSLVPSPNTSPGPGGSIAPLPVGQQAPDFAGIDHWLNSQPLTMAGLRGKVVLVDFWTYSCINCIRTLPYVEGWYQKYAADGLVIVGVHTPEFAFEHDTSNVQAAISRFGITYPVAQDNEYTTWTAYSNSYWPADYLIDASGHVRATHDGEGDYNTTEAQIRSLLTEAGAKGLPGAAPSASPPPIAQNQSPETYLGTDRQSGYVTAVPANGVGQFTFPSSLPSIDEWAVSGTFDFEAQYMQATAAGDKLEYAFEARDVYLVMSADSPTSIRVSVTGAGSVGSTEDISTDGSGTVGPARLYHLVHLGGLGHGTVTITFNGPGVRAYAFTFGG